MVAELDRASDGHRGQSAHVCIPMVYLFTYVYIVVVNKGHRFLWITPVYRLISGVYRMHNDPRCVWGASPFHGITFATQTAGVTCPVYVHIGFTAVEGGVPRVIHSVEWISIRRTWTEHTAAITHSRSRRHGFGPARELSP